MLTITVTELPVLTLRNYTVCEHWSFQIMERINQLTKSPSKVQPQLMGIINQLFHLGYIRNRLSW